MLTVIMAGGEGKRLRPLTCTVPKPMLPILGKPVIEYILDLLIEHGINDVITTTGYLGENIKSHFENGRYRNVKISFADETVPLGTAGGVANATGGRREEVLVISGDAVCDFDITSAINFHRRSGAAVTIIGKRVSDPREYGLMETDDEGRIIKFTEKPDFGKVSTDLANTGTYILSKETAASIPVGENTDFGKDIFPKLLSENQPIYVYEDKGYWCDIGSVKTYILCQHDILKGKVKCEIIKETDGDGNIIKTTVPEGVDIIPPVYIGENAVFGKTAVIGSFSVIEDGARIMSGSKIKGGIIGKYASLSERTTVSGGIVCAHSIIKRSASVYEEGVVGEYTAVGENSVVLPFVKVWPHKEIPTFSVVKDNVMFNVMPQEIFDETGISGDTGTEISPEFAVSVGRSAAAVNGMGNILIGCMDSPAAQAISRAVAVGINCGGKDAEITEPMPLSMFIFAMKSGRYDMGIYVNATVKCSISFFDNDGFYISRETERQITEGYLRSEFTSPEFMKYGKISVCDSIKNAYFKELAWNDKNALSSMGFSVNASDSTLSEIAKDAFSFMGCQADDKLKFFITNGGTVATAYSDKIGYIPGNKLLALAVLGKVSEGKDCAVFQKDPMTLDEMADFYGVKIYRIWETSVAHGDAKAREIGKKEYFLTDGLFLIKEIMMFLKRTGFSLEAALSIMPEFQTSEKTVKINVPVAEALSSFGNEEKIETGEGMCLVRNKGTVYLKPLKRGNGIKVYTESRKAEYSRELCEEIERILVSKP